MLKQQIRKWFFEAVQLDTEAPNELKDVLKRGHPNLDHFIDNLCGQIEKADKVCQSKGLVLKQKTLQNFTYDMAKYFMRGMEGEAKKRYESDIQRAAREAAEQQRKEFDAVLAGKAEGEFLEAGVISNEQIDKAREVELAKQDEARQKQKG